MPSVKYVFVLLSLIFAVSSVSGVGEDLCPDDLEKMLTKYNDLDQLARYCGAKHQFHCIELDGLLCTIFNLNFDCDAGGKAFCPNPLQAIDRLMNRSHNEQFRFGKVIIEANMNNGRNGSLTLPEGFLDELDRMESESLTLTNLNMTDLPSFKYRKSLKKITIWGNSIEVLKEHAFFELISLTSLDLQFNKIRQLAQRAFMGLDDLDELNLSNNLLMVIEERAFHKMPNLKTLTISNNQLYLIDSTVFFEIRSLTHLELSSNNFEELPELRELENLEFLAMNDNQLKKVRIERLFPSSFNRTTPQNDILSEVYPFEKLEIIEFNRNNITEFYCDPELPRLYNILLNRNLLTSLSKDMFFSYLNSSKMLAIKGNFWIFFFYFVNSSLLLRLSLVESSLNLLDLSSKRIFQLETFMDEWHLLVRNDPVTGIQLHLPWPTFLIASQIC